MFAGTRSRIDRNETDVTKLYEGLYAHMGRAQPHAGEVDHNQTDRVISCPGGAPALKQTHPTLHHDKPHASSASKRNDPPPSGYRDIRQHHHTHQKRQKCRRRVVSDPLVLHSHRPCTVALHNVRMRAPSDCPHRQYYISPPPFPSPGPSVMNEYREQIRVLIASVESSESAATGFARVPSPAPAAGHADSCCQTRAATSPL